MNMSETKQIVYSIIQFLNGQLEDGNLSEDGRESVEVGVQCLETAFGVSSVDKQLDTGRTLQQIFSCNTASCDQGASGVDEELVVEATAEQKQEADRLKNEGNIAVREERIQDAVEKYTQAIQLDRRNPAYFSNRAAAHTKLGNYLAAVKDAEQALKLDSGYTKAHSRIALAYAGLNRLPEAHAAIKRALEQEPNNESYQNNLRAIETRINEGATSGATGTSATSTTTAGGIFGGMAGGGGSGGMAGFNLENIMNNPALVNMASQMMQQPAMQQMMTSFMSAGGVPPSASFQDPPPAGTTPNSNNSNSNSETAPTEGGAVGLDALLHAGQRLAEQMRSSNPELINQLRQQMSGSTTSSDNPQQQQQQQQPPDQQDN